MKTASLSPTAVRLLCVIGITATVTASGQLAQSTFDVNTDGWSVVDRTIDSLEVIGTRAAVYQGTGGNPGGFINVLDGAGDFYFRAPAKFLGDKSAAYGHELQFDLITDLAAVPTALKYSVILIGGGITNFASFVNAPPANTWTHFSVLIQAGAPWTNAATGLPATQADLTSCLAALQSLDIAGEFGTGIDTGGIDSVVLFGAPPRFDYQVTFDSGITDPNFVLNAFTNTHWVPFGSGVGGVGIAGGLQLFKDAGIKDAQISYASTFSIIGDFEATVSCNRNDLGFATAGLIVYFAPNIIGWLDSCFVAGDSAAAVISFSGIPADQRNLNTSASQAVFRIRRVGTTLFAEVDVGQGFVGMMTNSNPNLVAPVRVGVFLSQLFGSSPANYALFDNLSVHADGVLCPLSVQCDTNCTLLKWPAWDGGCAVEATPSLSSVSWETVTNAPSLNGCFNTLTMNPAEPMKFFRMRWRSY